jgi:hypothetical protein
VRRVPAARCRRPRPPGQPSSRPGPPRDQHAGDDGGHGRPFTGAPLATPTCDISDISDQSDPGPLLPPQ